ncbi:HD domain-containing protein [Candidatus Parcubacteria bacterium]|nr:HD domain-containing protein [Candidatus Parcubacteria bacterium]
MKRSTKQIVEFLKEIDKLKEVKRQVHTTSGRQENSAEHSWHLALAVWLLKDELGFRLNTAKAVELALVHDLVEIYAGDTYFFDTEGHRDKNAREQKALVRLARQLPKPLGRELRQLWNEYETKYSPEACTVKALDKILPVIQNIISGAREWKKGKLTYERIVAAKNNIWPRFPQKRDVLWDILEDLLAEAKAKKLLK